MNKINYTDYITNNFANNPIWQNLSYDNEGLLWLDNICLVDLINRYGTPLQINYNKCVQCNYFPYCKYKKTGIDVVQLPSLF